MISYRVMREAARKRKNRKSLERAYTDTFWEIAESEPTASGDPGLTCPTHVISSAWVILDEELQWNPNWASHELREEDAGSGLRCLTRWLDANCEGLLTDDRERGKQHAARFIPLPGALRYRFSDDLDTDECYWRVREVMGDPLAEVQARVIRELGGTSGMWRGWITTHLEMLVEQGGRSSDFQCGVHPAG